MNNHRIQELLNAHGFPAGAVDGFVGPKTRAATARLQQATNAVPWLVVDGIPGPKTQAALGQLPKLSPHFVVAEVACKHCGHAYIRRELLAALEDWRAVLGGPITLISGYRCPEHNRAVGGAKFSMHVEGYAADPTVPVDVAELLPLHLFSGVGDEAGIVRHVDLRHLSAHNQTPDATPANPARWHY